MLLKCRSTFSCGGVGIFAQLVLHAERQVRLHAFEHLIEVVGIYLDELAFSQTRERLLPADR